MFHSCNPFYLRTGNQVWADYIQKYGNPDEEPISVTRTTSASRSPCSSSRSRSRSRSPRHDGGVLNLDTKSAKASAVVANDNDDGVEVTAFGKPSPKEKDPSEFKARFEEALQSRIQQEHAGPGNGFIRKRKFSPAADVEIHPDRADSVENGFVNGLDHHHHHHHPSVAKSRKTAHKDEPPVDYYPAAKEKPLSLVPKSNIEQLDLHKSLPIPKYSGLEPSSLPFPLPFIPRTSADLYHRPEIFPYLLPSYSAGSEATLPLFLHHFNYQHQLLQFSAPEEYQKEPPKDVRPPSSSRSSPSKEAPFYPPHVEPPSHPTQSSAVAPIH